MSEPESIDLTTQELEEFLSRLKGVVAPEDFRIIQGMADMLRQMTDLLEKKSVSIDRLRQLVLGFRTEKTANVFPEPKDEKTTKDRRSEKKKRKGHGRNGTDAYPGASKVSIPHESLKKGHHCPDCDQGKVYPMKEPSAVVRIKGQPFLKGTIYEAERLRCNLCGEVFTAKFPEEVGEKKYDETAGAMIAVLKYGSGLPFHRMAVLQGMFGVPVPASVQWEVVEEMAGEIHPVHQVLVDEAAHRDVVHNDDTGMKVLGLMKDREKEPASNLEDNEEKSPVDPERRGMFTSSIVSTGSGPPVALFFTGRKHAGENLTDVLRRRSSGIGPPIQMCDALSRNPPTGFKTILGNCLAHARRKAVEVASHFPAECQRILDDFEKVYQIDDLAREDGLTSKERLVLHQARSKPTMDRLHTWLNMQLDERLVEPNSTLGGVLKYLLNHWPELTLFLRQEGAPLDNNIAERALKMAILNRKNAYFYKTEHGAAVGDLFMSLIHTCRLNKANPFEYLSALLKYVDLVRQSPGQWLPWNYQGSIPVQEQATDQVA